ncbi:MAG: hypothetical protein JWO86_940 [Myxococcaceae bacterium]|nr:hypothetical protein [Myxococcaceae bacterium]
MKECALGLLLVSMALFGCSKPCTDSVVADAKEPLRPSLAPLGKLPPGAVQCLDTHPSASYDGSYITYPKLDPNGGDAETARALESQGWVKLPIPAKVQKAEFDAAVRGVSASTTKQVFRKPGTKNVLVVESAHAAAWKHGNIRRVYLYECAATPDYDYCEGI